jgi:predicted nucleic acid-binding protein
MIILDTNVVSEMVKPTPAEPVRHWFKSRDVRELALSAITVFEIRHGRNLLPQSARRRLLDYALHRIIDEEAFGQVLPFSLQAAECAADFSARRRRMGRPVEISDCLIAGHVLEHRAVLATRNGRDFDGVGLSLMNPWEIAS